MSEGQIDTLSPGQVRLIQLKLDAYTKWAWYLQDLLLSHNHMPATFSRFIKENNIPYPEEL